MFFRDFWKDWRTDDQGTRVCRLPGSLMMEASFWDNGFIWTQLILYQVFSLALIHVVICRTTTLGNITCLLTEYPSLPATENCSVFPSQGKIPLLTAHC